MSKNTFKHSYTAKCRNRLHVEVRSKKTLELRVRPPGIEWKTGRNPKGEKIGQKIENGHRPEMGKKWPKNGKKWDLGPFFYFFAIFGLFFPHFGPMAIFYFLPILSPFWISARFPFYTRRPDSLRWSVRVCVSALLRPALVIECSSLPSQFHA